ncbi:DUF4255 domain-containing protein [Undibacterium sp. Di26W]|uniref:DUF4255 domain-containing protein n=1 Tax=Undibacterium sp. Di26W TaxID=3413035 RepID=UPI003BF2266D
MVDSGQVLRWVSESLRTLIRANIEEFEVESAIVFDSPAEIDSQGETRLSLFLYKLDTNPHLRNLPPVLSRLPGADGAPNALAVTPAPLVVDLLYLMVPYARSAELELVLADKLVRLFHDVPALSGPWLRPQLKACGNSLIEIVPNAEPMATLHNIWSGFPNKPYKFTQLFTLSPVRIPGTTRLQSNMVTEGALEASTCLTPGAAAAGAA